MRAYQRPLLALLAVGLMMAACGGVSRPRAGGEPTTSQTDAPPPAETTAPPSETTLEQPPAHETTTTSGGVVTTVDPGTGAVPSAVVEAVIADAADQVSVASGELEVVKAEAVEWSDGSLGCPQPGVLYTQAIVPGFWIQIQAPDRFLDYRIDGAGNFTLCTDAVAPRDQTGGVAPDPTIPPPDDEGAPSS